MTFNFLRRSKAYETSASNRIRPWALILTILTKLLNQTAYSPKVTLGGGGEGGRVEVVLSDVKILICRELN